MKPSDISTDLSAPESLYDGFAAPEVLAELARDDWEVSANDRGLVLRAYQACSGSTTTGEEVVAWCVDEEDDMYLVVFDRSARRVHAVYERKATRTS